MSLGSKEQGLDAAAGLFLDFVPLPGWQVALAWMCSQGSGRGATHTSRSFITELFVVTCSVMTHPALAAMPYVGITGASEFALLRNLLPVSWFS